MKKKKGVSWFGEHVMNIIIAVVCIVILIFVGGKIYSVFSEKTDLEKAESNLKSIKEKIVFLKENNLESSELIIYPPKQWVLRSYFEKFPDASCYSKRSCLCFCQEGSCDNSVQKVCYGFDYAVEVVGSFEVPRSWLKRLVSELIIYNNAVGFLNSVEGLKIYKSQDKILIELLNQNEKSTG